MPAGLAGVRVSSLSSAAPEVARTGRLATLLRERGVDVLLVVHPANLRYLTGFTGSNGLALIVAGEGGVHRFLTDFRYDTQSAAQVPECFERRIVPLDLLEGATGELAQLQGGRLGFEEGVLTVKRHLRLRELLPAAWELIPCGGLVEELREVKEPHEIERIRAAA